MCVCMYNMGVYLHIVLYFGGGGGGTEWTKVKN